jgi:hypothetical protein
MRSLYHELVEARLKDHRQAGARADHFPFANQQLQPAIIEEQTTHEQN